MRTSIDELVHYYFNDPSYEIESVPFGLTNLTKIVKINNNKYVARVYNRHTKSIQSIELESKITSFLNNKNLAFQVPVFLSTLSGDEYIQLSDGALGAIVSFLEGDVPVLTEKQQALEFGRIVGQISSVMGDYPKELLGYQGKSFIEFYDLHPLAHRDAITSFIEQAPFHIAEAHLNFYQVMLSSVEESIDLLKELPRQLVHHDLLIFNLLCQDNKICGVLDFDFVSLDISFIEFAICLNHILQMSNGSLEMTEAFIKGYAMFRKGSLQEFRYIKLMTQIYHIAVLHIYIGQHCSGINIEQNFNYILNQFHTRMNWLNEHDTSIQKLLETYLL